MRFFLGVQYKSTAVAEDITVSSNKDITGRAIHTWNVFPLLAIWHSRALPQFQAPESTVSWKGWIRTDLDIL